MALHTPHRNRLDIILVERGLFPSREKAKRAVMAGLILVNDQKAKKPGQEVRPDDSITMIAQEKYVSRGGLKLEHALQIFDLQIAGRTAIDLGASTGGFTDCLLQAGAERVYAIDVGKGQLSWKLRQDPRVTVMEKTNARTLTLASFPDGFIPVSCVVIDCSFISLKKILPPAIPLLEASGQIIALIKPQFEAGKAEADKGQGVIRDPAIHQRVIEELREFVALENKLKWRNFTESPILGPAGNKEFLALIEKI